MHYISLSKLKAPILSVMFTFAYFATWISVWQKIATDILILNTFYTLIWGYFSLQVTASRSQICLFHFSFPKIIFLVLFMWVQICFFHCSSSFIFVLRGKCQKHNHLHNIHSQKEEFNVVYALIWFCIGCVWISNFTFDVKITKYNTIIILKTQCSNIPKPW